MAVARLAAAVVVVAAGVAASAPSAAIAHDTSTLTVEGHVEQDSVSYDPATEARLERTTRAASAADAAAAAARVGRNPSQVGEWGPVVDWPVVGIHVALLKNRKVLAYDSVGDDPAEWYDDHDFTRATVWDPTTGTQTLAYADTGHNVFCSGLAHLRSGTLFLAGGNLDSGLNGIVETHLFTSGSNSWSTGPDMASPRWYPTVTPMHNGEMLITSGGPGIPEVRRLDGSLRALSNASLGLPLYPWIDVAPNGRAFYSGPEETMRSLSTTGTGSWQSHGQRDSVYRDYGGHVLYDIGEILVAGGGSSSSSATVIDLNGSAPQVSATDSMETGRRQHNLTVLADGSVLATGGNSSGAGLVDIDNGVYTAELWSPDTGQWTTLSAMQITRQYHSTALLLPDGRVLSAGGGICGDCAAQGYLAKNAEVFSPPYLFKQDGSGDLARRPRITASPQTVTYGSQFQVSIDSPTPVSKMALVRLGAVTHSVNMEQRYVPLDFTAGTGTIDATAPANARIAPQGVYMLFAVNDRGVPSVARMVQVVRPG